MTLTECVLKDHVFIDFGAEILYGDDQAYLSYPCRFPTVGFELMATSLLCEIADRIRKDLGFKPLHPMDEYTDETCDQDGFYNFYVGLNGFTETRMDTSIDFVIVNSESADNESTYQIDLSEDEQRAMFNHLDEQCRKYLGKGCEELLEESRKKMEEDEK